MLKRVLHKLIGYKVRVRIPDLFVGCEKTQWITTRAWLSDDCTVRCNVVGKQCYLLPNGEVRGLPTEWKSEWTALAAGVNK